MNRAGPSAWSWCRSLAELGEMTARWLEGSAPWQPGYSDCGPAPETEPLVPVLAAANRAGFLTAGSQPGDITTDARGLRWVQAAAVTGFASPRDADLLVSIASGYRLACVVRQAPRWLTGYRTAAEVTWCEGRAVTRFGAALSRRYLADGHAGYGQCDRTAVRAVQNALQVTIADPKPGCADSVLWRALSEFASHKSGACPWCRRNQAVPLWPDCTCRADCGAGDCMRPWSVLAADATEGTQVGHPDDGHPVTIAATSDVAGQMRMFTTTSGETFRLGPADRLNLTEGTTTP